MRGDTVTWASLREDRPLVWKSPHPHGSTSGCHHKVTLSIRMEEVDGSKNIVDTASECKTCDAWAFYHEIAMAGM